VGRKPKHDEAHPEPLSLWDHKQSQLKVVEAPEYVGVQLRYKKFVRHFGPPRGSHTRAKTLDWVTRVIEDIFVQLFNLESQTNFKYLNEALEYHPEDVYMKKNTLNRGF